MQDDKIAPLDDAISIAAPAPAKPRRVRNMLIMLALAFVVGLGAMAWMLSQWSDARTLLIADQATPSPVPVEEQPMVLAPPAPVAALPAAPAGDVEQRIADLDARLARIDRGVSVSSQNALRAERLLVAFASRRALDRGLALGYLEEQLTSHFGSREPRAVATIIAASRDPATLTQLSAELEALKPALVGGGESNNWWTQVEQTIGQLVVVREAGPRSATPVDQFVQAASSLSAGRVDLALQTVAQMPGSGGATAWIARARRYVDANRALDILEAVALAEANVPPAAAPKVALPSGETL
jgi:hypothetical protein